jgi:fumarate reductase iron-sulfur subunit
MQEKFTFKIIRYNPQKENFTEEEYYLPAQKDLTLLEALHLINRKHHISLSYRFSCEMGICGSCGAMVNGKPVLMCSIFCHELKQPIEIRPLKNFPIIKDLVVNIDSAMNKLKSAMPYTKLAARKTGSINIQLKKDREKFEQASQCIKCMLCYATCPVYGFNNKFIGPAAAATAYRYNKDSKDNLKNKRMNSVTDKNGVWNCTHVGECSAVCPKNVDPNTTIQKLKIMGVIHSAKSIFKKK